MSSFTHMLFHLSLNIFVTMNMNGGVVPIFDHKSTLFPTY